jgi:osmoprotectant transport system permease protein
MIKYWQDNSARMMQLTVEHAQMVLIALIIAFLVAIVLIALFLRKKNRMNSLIYFFSLLYSVPSYAFFALLIPITGLGETTAIIVLAFYNEYVLLRTFITGIREVNPNHMLDYVKKYDVDVKSERVFDLEHVADAHRYLENSKSFGKVVVVED